MSYIEGLIADCKQALVTKPEKSFVLDDVADLDSIETAIYIIELTSGSAEKVFLDFVEYRQKRERACARLNSPSRTLYVGSSTTGVKTRICQHLGDGYKGTSALHLKHWCNASYQIRVLVYPDVPKSVLQIVEDSISHDLKPAFGKPGPNNK